MTWTDEPVRDAERYQMELESRPCIKCVLCGGPLFEGDEYFLIDDEPFCEDCAESCFKKEVTFD